MADTQDIKIDAERIHRLIHQQESNFLIGWIGACLVRKGSFTIADLEAAADAFNTWAKGYGDVRRSPRSRPTAATDEDRERR